MLYYFQLQYKRFSRYSIEFGLPAWLSIFLILVLFVGLVALISIKINCPGLALIGILLALLVLMTENKRITFLQNIFSSKDFYKIRLIENLSLAIPFTIAMSFLKFSWLIVLPSIFAITLAYPTKMTGIKFTLPTPFRNRPFEFIQGFRKYFPIFIFIYIIFIISLSVANYNLGLVCLACVNLLGLNFYFGQEPNYYLWIFNKGSRHFIHQKIIHSFINSIILSALPIGFLLLFFPRNWWITIGIMLLTLLNLAHVVVIKYSSYPLRINLLISIVVSVALFFPPLLLLTLPIFYRKAIFKSSLYVRN